MMTINDKNAHQRDALIKFEAGPHKYTCKGESDYISVTTWNHSHFKPFDADAIIKKMMRDPVKWAKSPYYGKTPEQIKAGWDLNRDEAAAAGTEMHANIERYYFGEPIGGNPLQPPLLGNSNTDLPPHFMDFVKDHPDIIPYRTEWMIFDEDVKIAGSIDMIGVSPLQPPLETSVTQDLLKITSNSSCGGVVGGEAPLIIYDWKRCKEIKENNSFKEFALTECIKHLPDTNFWHYSLQLNTYKAILEAKYDKKVEAMYLVCLHPNLPTYQLLQVPDLSSEVAALFALRKKQISEANISEANISEASISEANISIKSENKLITDYFSKKSI
jgi:hypothetical protein